MPCVYAIYSDDTLVYIGSTWSLADRLGYHQFCGTESGDFKTPWGPCQRLRIKYKLSRRYGDWLMDELRLIRRLRPRFNKTGIRRQPRAHW